MAFIVASRKDPASMNIAQRLLENYKFEKLSESFHENPIYSRKTKKLEVSLVIIEEEPVNAQFITDFFTPRLFAFLSRHSSASGIPTISVHTSGNLNSAEFGGIPRRVSVSPASAMKDFLLRISKLKKVMGLNYNVSYECTHHGPSLDVPAMFVELGSSPKQWGDLKAAEAVSHAVMAAIHKRNICKQSIYSIALGIGGPHYNAKFTQLALDTRVAFGHMIPKYAISKLDAEMIKQCVEKTLETVKSAILDWKGIKGVDKGRVAKMLGEIGMSIEKI